MSFRGLFRPHGYPWTDAEKRSKRSQQIRYFLTVYGARHYADRIGEDRMPARKGRIIL